MIPYEDYLPLLPHEYSYALYLSYGYDLCMYDPMILNMVSERYPRDEDYASDSDSVTAEDCDSDFSDEIPPWLFADLEEEDSSPRENDNFKILFGSFGKDSDRDTVSVISFSPIKPEIEGSNIKIGQVICSLNTVKPQTKISCDALFSDPEVKDENKSEKIFTDENKLEKISIDVGSEIANFFRKMVRIPDHLLVIKNVLPALQHPDRVSLTESLFLAPDFTAPDLICHDSDAFGLETTVSPPKKTTEHDFAETATSQLNEKQTDLIQALLRRYDFVFDPGVEFSFKPSISLILLPCFDFFICDLEKKSPDFDDEVNDSELLDIFNQVLVCDDSVCAKSFVDLSVTTSPEPPWNLLRCGFQPHDPGDVGEASGLILLAVLSVHILSWIGLTLGQNIGPLDSLITSPYWAIPLGLG